MRKTDEEALFSDYKKVAQDLEKAKEKILKDINIVEMLADEDDCAYDQPCKFGFRVEGHAVYCHNAEWSNSPRKCRRTWYTGGEIKDEDCEGYKPNEDKENGN